MNIKEQIDYLRYGDIEDLPAMCNYIADTLERLNAVYEAGQALKAAQTAVTESNDE